MASKVFNVAIIGYGLSARVFHIPFLKHVSGLNLRGVMQRWPENGFDVTADMPEIICYRSLEEVLADKEVDVVVVSTPPNTHYPLAKAVLEAKMNVIVEKPFTPTHAEAEELIALAKKQGVFVTVFQNRRWDSDYATLQKLINEGYLGRVVDFETHFDRHRPEAPAAASTWKIERIAGGSALYDLGPHMLDQIYHLFGSPKKITAFIGSQRAVNPTGYEDSFTVRMDYDNGLFATARSNVISPEERQIRFWVRGEAGSYKKYCLDVQEEQLRAGMNPGDKAFGREPEDRFGVLTCAKDGKITAARYPTIDPPTFAKFYEGVAKHLAGEAPLPVDPQDASNVIRLIELAQKSSEEGRTITV